MSAAASESMAARRKPVIFCDFDGTITLKDNIVAIMKHFQPAGWEELVRRTINRDISVREGVSQLFALMPSSRKEEIIRFAVDNAGIRPGFRELLDFCKERGIEFLVTSGGVDFFIHPLLAPYDLRPEQIYCNSSDFSGERIRIVWQHPCDEHCHNDCGTCKVKIIRGYPTDRYLRIIIGDSITDFEGAKLAEVVFARSHLAERCEELGMDYYAYEDFYEVADDLRRHVVAGSER